MNKITLIGLELAKSVFQIHGVTFRHNGARVFRRNGAT